MSTHAIGLTEVSQHGNEARCSVSLPQLSTTVTFSVGPGTKAQGLHRDDDIYHTQHSATSRHEQGRDTMLCLFVAGKQCTKQNGATRIVPGSHLWDFTVPPPSYTESPEMFAHAEMMPGDAFFMLGGVYHGAGSNVTADEERLVYAAFATRGYLRQEENQYLANDLSKIAELPLNIQRFAGFGTSKPYMGWIGNDMEEPVKLMNPDVEMEEPFFW
jgi:ectoine hydroxylase-related dioxygenase (phytanoyl-CoA dioxygenase family)